MNNLLGFAVVLIAMAFFFYWDYRKKKAKKAALSGETSGRVSRKSKTAPIQDYLQVDRLDGNHLVLKKNRYRQLIDIGNINPYALSEADAQSVRNNFRTLITMLRSPAQFIVRGRRMDLTDYRQWFSRTVQETATKWESEALLNYGRMLEAHLVEQGNKQRTLRENIFVVGAEPSMMGEQDLDEVKRTLWQDVETVVTGLRRCQVSANPMNDAGTIEALQQFFNKERLHARARDAIEYDSLRGYHIGSDDMTKIIK